MHGCCFAFEALAQSGLGVRRGRLEARGQAIVFRRVLERRLHRVVQRLDVPHIVEHVADAAVDADPLALVVELRVVARGAGQADELTRTVALEARRRNHGLGETDRQPIGVAAAVRGISG